MCVCVYIYIYKNIYIYIYILFFVCLALFHFELVRGYVSGYDTYELAFRNPSLSLVTFSKCWEV